MQNYMVMCRVRLDALNTLEVSVVHEVQAGSAVQQQSITSVLINNEPESVFSDKCIDTDGSDTMLAVFNWAILITDIITSSVEQYATKIVRLPY